MTAPIRQDRRRLFGAYAAHQTGSPFVEVFPELADQRAYHSAHHEKLTGLANRVLLADRIDLSIESRRSNRRLEAALFLTPDRIRPATLRPAGAAPR